MEVNLLFLLLFPRALAATAVPVTLQPFKSELVSVKIPTGASAVALVVSPVEESDSAENDYHGEGSRGSGEVPELEEVNVLPSRDTRSGETVQFAAHYQGNSVHWALDANLIK